MTLVLTAFIGFGGQAINRFSCPHKESPQENAHQGALVTGICATQRNMRPIPLSLCAAMESAILSGGKLQGTHRRCCWCWSRSAHGGCAAAVAAAARAGRPAVGPRPSALHRCGRCRCCRSCRCRSCTPPAPGPAVLRCPPFSAFPLRLHSQKLLCFAHQILELQEHV